MAKSFRGYLSGFKLVWTVFRVALNGKIGRLLMLRFPTEEEAATARREMLIADLRETLANIEGDKTNE